MYLLFSFTVGGAEKLVADLCNEMIVQNQDVYLYTNLKASSILEP